METPRDAATTRLTHAAVMRRWRPAAVTRRWNHAAVTTPSSSGAAKASEGLEWLTAAVIELGARRHVLPLQPTPRLQTQVPAGTATGLGTTDRHW